MQQDDRDLYQAIIVDHDTNPRHFFVLDKPTHTAEGYNPICGDRYRLFLCVEADVIQAISFDGHGCAISKASASIMTTMLKGKAVRDAEHLSERFHSLLTSANSVDEQALGELVALAGVRQFPIRVKCATLPWHTLRAALQGEQRASTE